MMTMNTARCEWLKIDEEDPFPILIYEFFDRTRFPIEMFFDKISERHIYILLSVLRGG